MTIIQIVDSLEMGGIERLCVDLALSHQAAGHRSIVYCLRGGGTLAAPLERARIPVIEFHRDRRTRLAVAWSIASQLKRDRASVIHGHNSGVHHFAAVAKRIAGAPVCVNTRHSAYSSHGTPHEERYFRLVEPLTDHVVFVCDYVRRQLAPRLNYPAAKCSVIVNGIPLASFMAHPAAPGSAAPRIRFGTVGRLVPAKGHAVLVNAFSAIAPRLPGAELCIYGDGPLRSELQAQIGRLGLGGRITLAGWSEDTARALESLDVFVFSSVHEGLPLVILEAMAAGLPIVSTRVGGVAEILPQGPFSWFCEPGDLNGLAEAMLRAADSPDLAAAGRAARNLAAGACGIEQMSGRYRDLFERLLHTS